VWVAKEPWEVVIGEFMLVGVPQIALSYLTTRR
jgi:hypothetical protein